MESSNKSKAAILFTVSRSLNKWPVLYSHPSMLYRSYPSKIWCWKITLVKAKYKIAWIKNLMYPDIQFDFYICVWNTKCMCALYCIFGSKILHLSIYQKYKKKLQKNPSFTDLLMLLNPDQARGDAGDYPSGHPERVRNTQVTSRLQGKHIIHSQLRAI